MSITADEAHSISTWVLEHRPDRAHLMREYTGEIDPDEEPYGDASAYHHPRRRRPWWKVALRGLVRAATWKYRRVL